MDIFLKNCPFRYETENLARLFFFTEGVRVTDSPDPDRCITVEQVSSETSQLCRVLLTMDGVHRSAYQRVNTSDPSDSACEYSISLMLFRLLRLATPVRPGWGILTGVRPVKLAGQLLEKGMGERQAYDYLLDHYLLTPEKASLALKTSHLEKSITDTDRPGDCSFYVSIPFCPSRCSYCSFVSQTVDRESRLMQDYVERLCEEIAVTGKKLRENGLRIRTVYYGGGTPGFLSAEQLRILTDCLAREADLSGVREYTVEVGRPDVVTREKLEVLRDAGVNRISINPQTMNDEVLRGVGRRHTAEQAVEAYRLAEGVGFRCINMDLIAGLPEDTLPSFQDTLSRVLALNPGNITVHTLSLKRAAFLRTEGYDRSLLYANPAAEMMNYAVRELDKAGYEPYYLYRQKNTLGNLENIGFARDGLYGLYNVFIMEETHTIAAVGAGGVTKLVDRPRNRIQRVFDYKHPAEYLAGFEEMLRRKDEIDTFYSI